MASIEQIMAVVDAHHRDPFSGPIVRCSCGNPCPEGLEAHQEAILTARLRHA